VITGEELRRVRKLAGLSQQTTADNIGVSLRTIGNWERGQFIHPNNWPAIVRVFPDIDGADEPILLSGTDQIEWVGDAIRESDGRAYAKYRHSKLEADSSARSHAQLAVGIDSVLDFAMEATKLEADPELVREVALAALNIVLDTGTLAVISKGENRVFGRHVMRRLAEVESAAASYKYQGTEDAPRISGVVNLRTSDVGGRPEDMSDEELQSRYSLAADHSEDDDDLDTRTP
jgi:DNA-binding XRE family transcriptional regulator